MTLFEKIYWTWFVVSIVLFFIFLAMEGDLDALVLLFAPIEIWIAFTIGYWIVKLILWMWGIDISLFPNLSLSKG